jgi:ergothioneine biosynthesis protein EgtB
MSTTIPTAGPPATDAAAELEATPASLAAAYAAVRRFTESLTEGLAPEDQVVQSMEDVSPTKWHLAHTSWFFETFVLQPHLAGYAPLDPVYAYLFNSYYVQAGERHCRAQRGYLSRPTVAEVAAYRRHVDAAMETLLAGADGAALARLAPLVTLGLNHEQQHQELLVTDIKHVFAVNPLRPVYRDRPAEAARAASAGGEASPPLRWLAYPERIVELGWDGRGFAFDNEGPRHRRLVGAFELADRAATAGDYIAFIEDGGYRRPELWLSAGWTTVQELGWEAPFYWERRDGEWWHYTLAGMRPVDPAEPVAHVSYFEADAYARWAGARLPTEEEWESVAAKQPVAGNLAATGRFHPAAAPAASPAAAAPAPAPRQLFGDVWEWTSSHYSPYPGYRPAEGALGEYNGKWMCGQFVLRGGSCATPAGHVRATYRNFFAPDACWQFSGVRLARTP